MTTRREWLTAMAEAAGVVALGRVVLPSGLSQPVPTPTVWRPEYKRRTDTPTNQIAQYDLQLVRVEPNADSRMTRYTFSTIL